MTQPPARPPFPPPHPMRLPGPVPPRPALRRGVVAGVLAGLFALAAAGLAIGGIFAVIHTVANNYDTRTDFSYDVTWWGTKYQDVNVLGGNPDSLGGLAPLAAAAALLLGAVFVFVAATSGRLRTASRSVLSLGCGILAGAVTLQALGTLQDMSGWNEKELEPGESLDFTTSLGLWLPLAGMGLAVVAAVLAHVGRRPAPARVEPNTPRMGFPMPYGPGGPGGPVPGQQQAGPGQSSGRYPVVGTSTGRHAAVGTPAGAPVVGTPAGQPMAGTPAGRPAVGAPAAPEAPDAPTVAPPSVGAEAAAAHAAAPTDAPTDAPISARLDDESPLDADVTQRTTVLTPPAHDAPTVVPPPVRGEAPTVSAPGGAPAPIPAAPVPPSTPATPAAPSAPAEAAVHATPSPPAPPGPPAPPADAAPSTSDTPSSDAPPSDAPPSDPAADEPAASGPAPTDPAPTEPAADKPAPGTSGLSNLPAAPPAPELAEEDNSK